MSLSAQWFELFALPFRHVPLIWGIVPLYFGWFLNEITSSRASYRTSVQNGFSFIWAGAHWVYLATHRSPQSPRPLDLVSVVVTIAVIVIGLMALWGGLRRRYPAGWSFLGHARFANYFMIAIFPMQAGYLAWTWSRVGAIALFALPVWVILHFGLQPLRR